MADHGYDFVHVVDKYRVVLDLLCTHPDIDADLKKYYNNYLVHAIQEFAAVDNDEQKILAKYGGRASWQECSLRGGILSIVGEIGEMIMVWHYTTLGYNVSRCPDEKDQKLGRDLWIWKSNYPSKYSVSVKVRKLYNYQMQLRKKDFLAEPDKLDRIAYVLLDECMLFQCNYADIRQFYQSQKHLADGSMTTSSADFTTYKHNQVRKDLPI